MDFIKKKTIKNYLKKKFNNFSYDLLKEVDLQK